jgi:hypothetical protein
MQYKKIIVLFVCFFSVITGKTLLHLTFHKGCMREIEYVAAECGLELTTLFIPNLPPFSFDPLSHGNVLYNMGHDRAIRIWHNLSSFFEQFDVVLVSDTAPLSRIFLQNDWNKSLIIWICNRFDYTDYASLDCDFPDKEYYDLFRNATQLSHVSIVSYMNFEQYYLQERGIIITKDTIKPCAPVEISSTSNESFIPAAVVKEETFFIPPYHNDTIFVDLEKKCSDLGIPSYRGRYNGVQDLYGFKGIIHIPYSWSTIAFFENMQLGIPYFIPSFSFLKQLVGQGKLNFFHPQAEILLDKERVDLSDWYSKEFESIITYFDSWSDLQEKIQGTNFDVLSKKIKSFALMHKKIMIAKWKQIFYVV